jgi:CIC family chloride channel protein
MLASCTYPQREYNGPIFHFNGMGMYKRGIEKYIISSEFGLIFTALLVGISTAIGAIIFRYLINGVEWIGYSWFPQAFRGIGRLYVIVVPAVGGLIVGPLIYFFAREAKGHGVPEVMAAVALRGGRIRPIVAIVKSLASSISIGSGGSVGREGPIVQIGSAIGSVIGQRLNVSEDRLRNLVACGAAAGIAATFNAPIAGVIFALEVILGEFSVRHFSSVVVSSVAASVIGRAVFGNVPAFVMPLHYGVNSLWEFIFYPVLGLFTALFGVAIVRMIYWAEDLFDGWHGVPDWVKPAIGGILLGVMALSYPGVTGVTWSGVPQVFNVGYGTIESALASDLSLRFAFFLLLLKLLATSLTLGSGGSGGVFAPSLFMGAMLGTAFDLVLRMIFPGIPAPPGAYALVGMAAMFAATAHAPITAVLILFELTGDYRIILPLMLTVVITTIVAQRLLKGESIYTLKLTRRGIRLQRGRDLDILESVRVAEVMSSELNTISVEDSLEAFSRMIHQTHRHGAIVVNTEGHLWGIITLSDFETALANQRSLEATAVFEVATPISRLLTTFPDETIGQALSRMSPRGLGRLPVVSREDPRRVVGVIRRQDIVRAYHFALTRRSEIAHRARQIEFRDGSEIIQLYAAEGAQCVGQQVMEIANEIPVESLLIAIRRDEKVIIPHGNTVIQPGDYISILVSSEKVDEVTDWFVSRLDFETQENLHHE